MGAGPDLAEQRVVPFPVRSLSTTSLVCYRFRYDGLPKPVEASRQDLAFTSRRQSAEK